MAENASPEKNTIDVAPVASVVAPGDGEPILGGDKPMKFGTKDGDIEVQEIHLQHKMGRIENI